MEKFVLFGLGLLFIGLAFFIIVLAIEKYKDIFDN